MATCLTRSSLTGLCLLMACGQGHAGDELARTTQPERNAPASAPTHAEKVTNTPRTQPTPTAGMLFVEGGDFFMGIDAPTRDTGYPQGAVVRVGPFFIDRVEVTVGEYLECQRAGSCSSELHSEGRNCNAVAKPPRLSHPINCVTWGEADRFCQARGKRLPTAIEWERAARGTDRRVYPWGNALPEEQVCWQGRKGKRKSATCEVGSFPEGVSAYGALDMSGSVEEWTTTVIPGAFPAPIYQTRGGSYEFDPVEEPEWTDRRVDFPGSGNPSSPRPTVGFRCVKDAD